MVFIRYLQKEKHIGYSLKERRRKSFMRQYFLYLFSSFHFISFPFLFCIIFSLSFLLIYNVACFPLMLFHTTSSPSKKGKKNTLSLTHSALLATTSLSVSKYPAPKVLLKNNANPFLHVLHMFNHSSFLISDHTTHFTGQLSQTPLSWWSLQKVQ